MSKLQAAKLNIALSLFFAAVLIATGAFVEKESKSLVMGLLIAAWFVPFSILSNWKGECVRAKVKCREDSSDRG